MSVRYRETDQLLRLLRLKSVERQQILTKPAHVVWHRPPRQLLRFQRR